MILMSGMYNVYNADGSMLINNIGAVEVGPAFTQMAIESSFSGWGAPFVAVSLFFFAFTTLMAYYYIAETNVAYITQSVHSKWITLPLQIVMLISVYYGSVRTAGVAWAMGDLGVGIMAWLNLFAIFLLRRPALKALQDYEQQQKAGLDPSFDPEKFGIHSGAWNKNSKSQNQEGKDPKLKIATQTPN